MICKVCNTENRDDAQFCENCGATLEEEMFSSSKQVASEATSAPEVDPGKGLGTTSLILGIAALASGTICSCVAACLGGALPLAMAIVAIILGNKAQYKSTSAGFYNNGAAKTGKALGIVAIIVIVIFIILNAILGATGALSNPGYYYY